MELFGIKFAPLNVPLQRRLQTLAAGSWFVVMAFGGFMGLFLGLYIILFTKYWWATILYLTWAWGPDRNACERGYRRVEWVRDWAWWKYVRDYFPLRLERVPWVELDPKKNYLFCCFPHGMLSTGVFMSFSTTANGFHEIFPNHKSWGLTLAQHFHMPFFRELALSLGGISASQNSLNYLLGKPEGGNVVALVVGGVAEAYNCKPGQYKLVINNRKGFIKIALKNGSPLVPVISFGETDLYTQLESPEGSLTRKIQEWLRSVIGIAPTFPNGRGFFQYSFGLVPQRRPVTTVVGKPIEIEKNENPTKEEVDELHKKFIEKLEELFEEQKYNYVEDAENTHLVLS